MSIPLLSSMMDRAIACAATVFYQGQEKEKDIDLQNIQSRATYLMCIRSLLAATPGIVLPRDVALSFNTAQDMSLNTGYTYIMDPKASGDFKTPTTSMGDREEGSSKGGSESTTETSVADPSATSEGSPAFERSPVGKAVFRISQEASFTANGPMVDGSGCTTQISISVVGESPGGALTFSVGPKASISEPRVNTSVIEIENPSFIYTIPDPLALQDETLILVFETLMRPEPPPFNVRWTFAKTGTAAEIAIHIDAKARMSRVIVGLTADGLDDSVCEAADLTFGGPNIILTYRGVIEQEEEISLSVAATVAQDYQPPEMVQVQCKLRGFSFGGIGISLCPSDRQLPYTMGTLSRDVLVKRSVWPCQG
jgi:hypothetical protein